jgi:NAD(P)-dependent dehydrogenase (short-subunit alcohol dehydrogenase family)
LILNAGFQDFGKQSWTDDGFDVTFAANYLGHWLPTLLLLKSMNKEAGRIIVIGSQSHEYDFLSDFFGLSINSLALNNQHGQNQQAMRLIYNAL